MIGYRHYIRLDEHNKIIKVFSDWQGEEILETDIEVTDKIPEADSGLRQFNLPIHKDFKLALRWNRGTEKIEELTEDELHPIEELKVEKIKKLKQVTTEFINSVYEPHERENALLGINRYKDKAMVYKKFIEDCLIVYDNKKIEINNCKNKKELNLIELKFMI